MNKLKVECWCACDLFAAQELLLHIMVLRRCLQEDQEPWLEYFRISH